jgi:mono/diheme cytochrome c family protein
MSRLVLVASLLLRVASFAVADEAEPAAKQEKPSPEQVAFFENKVRPVLVEHCYACHGPAGAAKGDLRVDSRSALLAGGESGPAVVPKDLDESLLISAIKYESYEMPPSGQLSEAKIAALVRWVEMGAPWPGADDAPPQRDHQGSAITSEDREYWAFQPILRPSVPDADALQGSETTGARETNAIDAFLLHRLAKEQLAYNRPATRRELIRRAYFDLVGLPPSPSEVDAFVADESPEAYEDLLDRLLASPQYGERWGRHWLDLVRFAQSNGYERDDEKPLAWRYRDYVIRAFNEDKPYDQFVREQLAGDELDEITDDSITATAFYRLGVWDDEPDDRRQAEFDGLDDMVSTVGSAFLGLTLGCARCHDHKFDPVPQEDYYSMVAFLRNVKYYEKPRKPEEDQTIFAALPASGEHTLAVRESGAKAPPTHVLIRGNAATPGDEVQPRFLRVLCESDAAATPDVPEPGPDQKTSGRRRILADWIASPKNPLTARVIVNRLWKHHFGRGIVASPSDFGQTGRPPSHPELLDYLATELIEGRWHLKRMHKMIMLSAAYRQSSRAENPHGQSIDPGNSLLWRQNLRRLEAEAIRDSILATSGNLNPEMGGRGIFPELPPEVLATQSRPGAGWGNSDAPQRARRSVYVFVKRTLGVPFLETLDFPTPDKPQPTRPTTTIAPQALILLNSRFMDRQAGVFADRLLQEAGSAASDKVDHAYRLALQRGPTDDERKTLLDFLQRQGTAWRQIVDDEEQAGRAALQSLCLLVLNLNEFVYID